MGNETRLPKPEVKGVGYVRYRCADCDELMEPEDAVIIEGRAWHPEHQPQETDDGS